MTRQEKIREGISWYLAEIYTAGKNGTTINYRTKWNEMAEYEASQDVAIKVEGELPSIFDPGDNVMDAMEYGRKLEGFTRWEPLIEE